MLLLAGIGSPVVPEEARKTIGIGGLHDILQIIEEEPPGTVVGLGTHRTAELSQIARYTLVDIIGA